jgi:hypothetical protein
MKKATLFGVLAIMAGGVFIGVVGSQETSNPEVFIGIVTKVVPEKEGFIVQNEEGEIFFHWSGKTKFRGSLPGNGDPISKNLREGMTVTIFYREVEKTRVASLIEIKRSGFGTLKGWEHPFGCGVSLC